MKAPRSSTNTCSSDRLEACETRALQISFNEASFINSLPTNSNPTNLVGNCRVHRNEISGVDMRVDHKVISLSSEDSRKAADTNVSK